MTLHNLIIRCLWPEIPYLERNLTKDQQRKEPMMVLLYSELFIFESIWTLEDLMRLFAPLLPSANSFWAFLKNAVSLRIILLRWMADDKREFAKNFDEFKGGLLTLWEKNYGVEINFLRSKLISIILILFFSPDPTSLRSLRWSNIRIGSQGAKLQLGEVPESCRPVWTAGQRCVHQD